ncbi:NADP-dependent isocitrate dehydrogenase [Granulosicoccus antarcticus]|uniref:Isocitrate dehydrogenase [NADP] n=1 Tax=Granulosicoccus antarcticus IMCC3135 TaxID=1192854 RepID=A0A2Z2NMD9_9GAMM|nr:NADP-dependent isocitrate dehydrogenase [Granulosicoccus antarcticus]ASJ72526.1 Isocitrate dehydrogenase [NADP] [Granulosicoccus antarcticus IMCC3135]
MTDRSPTVIYTLTDEAPALATHSFLPIVQTFTRAAGISVETRDISLASRILCQFNDRLTAEQQTHDALSELGSLATQPEANIIKLPNISASIPQLKVAIAELQSQGYDLPEYPDNASTAEEKDVRQRYDRVKGSAVNPVLREGNSDRRAPAAVKNYARTNPHAMGAWSSESASHVSHMSSGDFYSNEQSVTMASDDTLRIQHVAADGSITVLKSGLSVLSGEIADATFMSRQALRSFLIEQINEAKDQGVLLSLHLKATMMKVSDPIIFGHAVRAYFAELFEQFGETLAAAGADPNNGLGSVLEAVESLPAAEQEAIKQCIAACYEKGPALAMVNSDKGISNLHVPSDVIVDASMPAMIRTSGKMWNGSGQLQDTKALIPDNCYAGVYQETINFCRANGAFDPATMGTVPNVGLMAQKAEEYGSHDKTFEIPADGTIQVVDSSDTVLMSHEVQTGDIWRMCNVKDEPVRDWVKLAVSRARATGSPAIFWLDDKRAHDSQLISKVNTYLQDHDTEGLAISIMSPEEATRFTLARLKNGEETISVTGNVLRDYLTDLFPILELGTSAKMLSIVPLMQGGGMFETGAGGSAPKHVQQLVEENHLRWDSLGEFLALAVSLEHFAINADITSAQTLADSLDAATSKLLLEGKSPSRRVNELDNRGSHFYLAMYWAEALTQQSDNPQLQAHFAPLAKALREAEVAILEELVAVQGKPVDIGGYYNPDIAKCEQIMRPSQTFNQILARF